LRVQLFLISANSTAIPASRKKLSENPENQYSSDWKHRVVGGGIVRAASRRDAPPFQNDADDSADDGEKDEKRQRDKVNGGIGRPCAFISGESPENSPCSSLRRPD